MAPEAGPRHRDAVYRAAHPALAAACARCGHSFSPCNTQAGVYHGVPWDLQREGCDSVEGLIAQASATALS